ncbi:MAG: hypothetical protein EB168_08185 [Euryarchaeota archaeon]|nr:hypothetical protein [Euryarchaeota archaeon]
MPDLTPILELFHQLPDGTGKFALQRIKWEIAEGKRPNASLEGAMLIEQDAMAVQNMVIEQISLSRANSQAG